MMVASLKESIGLINPLGPDRNRGLGQAVVNERWSRVDLELAELRNLAPDWDGQGGAKPDFENVVAATHWVERMRAWPQALPPAKIAPGVAGEIHFIWQQGQLVLDAEITSPESVHWLLSVPGRPARQWTTDTADTWLVGLLEDQ
jgi:hypothetical protein